MSKWDFFIAHATPDKDPAERLYDLLLQANTRPFLDSKCVLLGDNWDNALSEAQKASLITVVLISELTNNAYYQREEIAAAISLARENEQAHRVVPVYLHTDGATAGLVPYGLRLKHSILMSNETGMEEVANRLVDLLRVLQSKSIHPPDVVAPDDNMRTSGTRSAPDLKYYVYISRTKVDMLWPQIGNQYSPKDGIDRLKAVVKFLRDSDRIGSIDEPKAYFEGRLTMRWGAYGDSLITTDSSLVYFGGLTDNTILGLGGSAHHVIGNQGGSSPHSQSAMPYMIAYLRKHLQMDKKPELALLDYTTQNDGPDLVLQAIHLATTRMKGPEQTLEFVARFLKQGPSPYPQRDTQSGMKVLLGTPIYVALIE